MSLTGDSMFDITVLLWVTTVIAKASRGLRRPGAESSSRPPYPCVAVGPVAGVLVDRWNRRHTMMAADAFRAVRTTSMLAVPALAMPQAGYRN